MKEEPRSIYCFRPSLAPGNGALTRGWSAAEDRTRLKGKIFRRLGAMRGAISRAVPFGLLAAFFLASAAGAEPSEGVDDVIKLAKGGVGEEILAAFVETSEIAYDLSADEILALSEAKVPQSIIAMMIRKGAELRAKRAEAKADRDGETKADRGAEAEAGEDGGERKAGGAGEPAEPVPPPERVSLADEQTSAEPAKAAPASRKNPGDSDTAATVKIIVPEEVTVSFFYESLLPYGTWVRVPAYGWVWQPSVVVADPFWRPYCHRGRWIWTDYGWYWRSYYPWGWAVFHYGRWVWLPGHRWVWVPGTVWAPAWVHWRCSETYFGWAPLPPEADFRLDIGFSFRGSKVSADFHFGLAEPHYTFVPRTCLLEADVASVAVPPAQVTNIYNSTVIVNNTYVYRNKTVIHAGVSKDEVARDIRRRIETVRIAEHDSKPGGLVRPETEEGDRIKVFRPAVFAKVTEEPPRIADRIRMAMKARPPAPPASSASSPPASSASRPPAGWMPQRRTADGAASGGASAPPAKSPAPSPKSTPDAAGPGPDNPSVSRPDPRYRSDPGYRSEPVSRQEPGFRSESGPRSEPRPSWTQHGESGKPEGDAKPKAEAIKRAIEESRTKAQPEPGTVKGTGTNSEETIRKALEENARRRAMEETALDKAAEDPRKAPGDARGAPADARREAEELRKKATEDAIRRRIEDRGKDEAPPREKARDDSKKGETQPSLPWGGASPRRGSEAQPRPPEPPPGAASAAPEPPAPPPEPVVPPPEAERRGGSFVPPPAEEPPSSRKKKSKAGKN